MDIALIMPDRDTDALAAALADRLPDVRVQIAGAIDDPEAVGLAVAWQASVDDLVELRALRAILSFGAGADQLLRVAPPNVPLGRIVSPSLAEQMTAYLLAAVLHPLREFDRYRSLQQKTRWAPRLEPRRTRIGFLGYGELARHAAQAFSHLGVPVQAWCRSPRRDAVVDLHHGSQGLRAVAASSDFLIALLPLTDATRGLIDAALLGVMPEGSTLIQVGRGGQLVEDDLLAALDQGRPARARIDVFAEEPLPSSHRFWHHPSIDVTPHVAAITDMDAAASAIARDYERLRAGHGPTHAVDRDRGY